MRARPLWAGMVRALGLAGVAAVLMAVRLPGGLPPMLQPGRLVAWWSSTGAVAATYGAVRLVVASVVAGWAVILAVRSVVGGTEWGVRLSARAAVRLAAGGRRLGASGLLRLVLGASAGGTVTVGCAVPGGGRPAPAPTKVMLVSSAPTLPPPLLMYRPEGAPVARPATSETVPSRSAVPDAAPRGRATGQPRAPAPTKAVAPQPSAPLSPRRAAHPPPPTAAAPPAGTWTVRPGDDLWSIALRVISGTGDQADDRTVANYWQDLIRINSSRLPIRSDPSLIFPGDVLLLPPVSS